MTLHQRKYLALLILFGVFLSTDKQFGFSNWVIAMDSVAFLYSGIRFIWSEDSDA